MFLTPELDKYMEGRKRLINSLSQNNAAEINQSLKSFEDILETTEMREKEKELLVFADAQQEHINSTPRISLFLLEF